MPHVGLSEHDDNLNSVCARGKSSIARKPEIHQKKKKHHWHVVSSKKLHLDFKFYLGKLNNKIFSHTVQCQFCVFFHCIKQYKKAETQITPHRENFIS